MPDFATLLSQGSAHAWLFVPSAILLGALHGLEPGHSKTMMAAFIVAVRGTVGQAVLLGLAATLSHTAVVWGIAFAGMYLWRGVDADVFEPYFQLASAAIIIALAIWMLWRTWQDQKQVKTAPHHDHAGHAHDEHDHHHGPLQRVDTGHGVVNVEIFERGVAPVWRLHSGKGHVLRAADVTMVTARPGGAQQAFAFVQKSGYLESTDPVAEPHHFAARLRIGHGDHTHEYELSFVEGDAHRLDDTPPGLDVGSAAYQDAHERAHANDIRRKFADRDVTTGQIVLFGLTGGLIPCPAAITVLLLCLQLKEFTLGFALVLCFSIGLAITLVTVGALAALSVRQATKRWSWFGAAARRAPYFSGLLIIAVGLYVGLHGWNGLMAQAALR